MPYIVLRSPHAQFEPFLNHDLRVDSAARTGFSLFDRKRSVCVGGLPSTATEGDLKVALEKFGKVQSENKYYRQSEISNDAAQRSSLWFTVLIV